MSTRAYSCLITIWNRVAPVSAPGSKTNDVDLLSVEEMERGTERMKEYILRGIGQDLRPQTAYYRVYLSWDR
jgi:hypothetical protein